MTRRQCHYTTVHKMVYTLCQKVEIILRAPLNEVTWKLRQTRFSGIDGPNKPILALMLRLVAEQLKFDDVDVVTLLSRI